MSSSLACSSYADVPKLKKKPLQQRKRSILVKAQRFPEEGAPNQSHIVDANLSILTKRIDEIKLKERLERCCRCDLGWNYAPGYENLKPKLQRNPQVMTLFQALCLVGVNIGFTFVGGTFCLCMISLVVHLCSSTN